MKTDVLCNALGCILRFDGDDDDEDDDDDDNDNDADRKKNRAPGKTTFCLSVTEFQRSQST